LFACKKESSSTLPEGDKLLEVTTVDEHLKLQYDANGLVTKAFVKDVTATNGDEVVFNITYGSAGQINEVRKSDGEIIKPIYENNVLVRADVLSGIERIGYTSYEYLNGFVKSAEIKFVAFGDEISTMKFVFNYDAQQRVQRTNVWLYNPLTQTLVPAGYTTTEYDNKKNPLHAVKDLMLLLWEVPAVNNIIKEVQHNEDNTIDEIREYSYTYNDKQQPTQAVLKTTAGGQQSNTNINFRYR
jgi:hypothetical protein